ncbi:hypothetical protein ACFQ58_15330 [Agromyces sp. NPDC056523]|uniref:hypothetical protein n=1 Tax=Agromyces sp. NPDC056523 TaxID=3345850 RepID=UPI00366FBC64
MAPQPSLEDAGLVSLQESTDEDGWSQVSASLTYQLWRNPANRDDPVNLRELDEAMRRSLEEEPPWPRPAWLIERVQRMRYPLLWETVRTNWSREVSEYVSVARQLVEHTNYILMNQYREELGLGPGPTIDGMWSVTEAAVNPVAASLDRVEVPAVEIDTDPFVYALGLTLDEHTSVTAVIPREHLDYVRIAFATRVTRE